MYLKSSVVCFLVFLVAISTCSATNEKPKVIVIGAGVAGLAATTKLLENGIDVTVLEAESRIGGRIHTVDFGDGHVELGSSFCSARNNNVVYELVKDLDLLEEVPNKINLLVTDKKFYEDGFLDKIIETFYDVWETTPLKSGEELNDSDFMKKFTVAIKKKFPDEKKQTDALWASFNLASTLPHPENRNLLSWKKSGQQILLDVIMQNYPNKSEDFDVRSKVQTEKVVEKIDWSGEEVVVKCKGGEEMKADYVIFTPSLGVLKEKHGEMFSPGLPEEKVKAIETVAFVNIAIVYLHIPEPWWPKEDFSGYSLLWRIGDGEMISADYKTELNGSNWVFDLTEIKTVKGNPNVLQVWFSEDTGEEIEVMDDQTLIDGIDYMLKKFSNPSTNILKADKIIKTKWYHNPNFRGNWVVETPESSQLKDPSRYERLVTPLMKSDKPMVMFAGDAMADSELSTIGAALTSGQREAQRIIDQINKKNKVTN